LSHPRQWPARVALGLLLPGSTWISAAPPQPAAPASAQAEVIVSFQRERPSDLHAQIVRIEDRLFAAYDKLNPDHQYDIICRTDATTGTLLRSRTCLPAFVRSAREAEADDLLSQFHLDGHPAPPASMVIMAKRQSFKDHYRRIIHAHPELLRLDQEYGELLRRYQAVRK